jgi:hypothetical protein
MNYAQLHSPAVRTVQPVTPPMDTPCACGLRYGQHRVGDYRCPNQEWKPGNGQPQWKTDVFRRTA